MLEPYHTKAGIEAGVDEAGRGCIAGPVFASAVVLPVDFYHPMLNDSKKLSPAKRKIMREVIENEAIAFGVARAGEQEIDRFNILNASFMAMHRALDKLKPAPGHLLIDGNRFQPYREIPHTCIVKGDGRFSSIAAASVLAKTYRDEYMEMIHLQYPEYGWDRNRGYPTSAHRKAVERFGPSPFHRRSFRLINAQTKLSFS